MGGGGGTGGVVWWWGYLVMGRGLCLRPGDCNASPSFEGNDGPLMGLSFLFCFFTFNSCLFFFFLNLDGQALPRARKRKRPVSV